MLFLKNVKFDTKRASYSGGTTSAPATWLTGVYAHADAPMGMYAPGQPGMFHRMYQFIVESGTDIEIGDILTNITLLDGVTPWPNERSEVNVTWIVKDAAEESAAMLPSRKLHVERVVGGGKVHL